MRISRRSFSLIVAAFLQPLGQAQHNPADTKCGCRRVYSSVRLVPDVDDYVGSELVIWRSSGHDIQAEWRVYEGGHNPTRAQLRGTCVDGKVILRGTLPGGDPVQIQAALRGRTLSGTALIGEFSEFPIKLPSARLTWAERVQRR